MISFLEFAGEILPQLIYASKLTLLLSILSITLGAIIGLGLAFVRLYGNKYIYLLATWYIEFIRGTPSMVQLFIIYYGLPDLGIILTPLVAASITFILNTSAYQAEYFRGAIQSIPEGQMIAARSLGMNAFQILRRITIPQMTRIVIPSWSNEAILMIKDTSLAFLVGVPELMATANLIAFHTYRYLEVYSIASLIYVAYITIFTKILSMLEEKMRIPGLTGKREAVA